MIRLEELWPLFIITSEKLNHDNPTHILSESNETEYEPQSMYALDETLDMPLIGCICEIYKMQ